MHQVTRKLLDRAFSGLGITAVVLLALALLVLLLPIAIRGAGAFVFRGTIEYRQMSLEVFDRGVRAAVTAEAAEARAARQPVYDLLARYEEELGRVPMAKRRTALKNLQQLKTDLRVLLGPPPGTPQPVLLRDRYGQTRWDRAQVKLRKVLFSETYDYSDPTKMGVKVLRPRAEQFAGTTLEPLFAYLPEHLEAMLRPRWTFYPQFVTDDSSDAHFFGGVWPEMLGTIYLTLGAMLFAIPLGVLSAIYLVEYARDGRVLGTLRTFINTLAGVPSIVFGLFGLAFFINTLHVSPSKSVLAGSLTLALLVLPVVIRAAEEALRAVPATYKEAALSLGAGKWRAVLTVILPAALPGILTGVVISMGRAAGETAPIIFTAAVSVGQPLTPWETLSQPTPALPWNIYNLATEHQALDEIRHVQYGMVLTLVLVVLLLNVAAIVLRARIARKLRG